MELWDLGPRDLRAAETAVLLPSDAEHSPLAQLTAVSALYSLPMRQRLAHTSHGNEENDWQADSTREWSSRKGDALEY